MLNASSDFGVGSRSLRLEHQWSFLSLLGERSTAGKLESSGGNMASKLSKLAGRHMNRWNCGNAHRFLFHARGSLEVL